MPEVCLDYFGIHRQCYEIFAKVEQAAVAQNPQIDRLGPWRLDEAPEAPFGIASKFPQTLPDQTTLITSQ